MHMPVLAETQKYDFVTTSASALRYVQFQCKSQLGFDENFGNIAMSLYQHMCWLEQKQFSAKHVKPDQSKKLKQK